LHGCVRKGCGDGIREALETIYDRNQDILQPTVLQLCHHGEPEFGALVVSDPKTENLAHAIPADAEGHVDGFALDHAAIGVADFDPERVKMTMGYIRSSARDCHSRTSSSTASLTRLIKSGETCKP
jgi:hypothetical protein